MRSFNKLANLHRVFFKRAEESFANKTTNSPIDDLNKGVMAGGEKYPGQFMSLANPANNKSYFNNHNMPRAHAGPGHSRMATGIDAPASTGARPAPPMAGQPTPADQLKTMGSNISSGINNKLNNAADAAAAAIEAFASRQGLGLSPQDDFRRGMGMGDAYNAGRGFLGGMMNPRNGGNPILAAANRNVLVPGATAAAYASPDVKKVMGNVFKPPKANNPDNFNDVNSAPPRKY